MRSKMIMHIMSHTCFCHQLAPTTDYTGENSDRDHVACSDISCSSQAAQEFRDDNVSRSSWTRAVPLLCRYVHSNLVEDLLECVLKYRTILCNECVSQYNQIRGSTTW